MKLTDFIRHLQMHGCKLHREGGSHTIYINQNNGKKASVPRHREIKFPTAIRICRQLEIVLPDKR